MRGGNSIRCEEKQTKPEIANYSRENAGVPLLAPGAGAHYIMDAWNNGKMQVGTVQESLLASPAGSAAGQKKGTAHEGVEVRGAADTS